MPRTTDELVKGVLRLASQGGDYDDYNSPSLTPYIDWATLIVSRVATCATTKGITLSSEELEMIERWLSAHGYAMSDQVYAENKTADASAVYQGRTAMHFEATKYGQNAIAVDYSGCLAAIGKGQRARLVWLGRRPTEQTDYVDRR